ncbi:MAG: hypothetical protein CTY20_00810 [Hyphomicrobium sp.]|nr:MAG: hypothetical protein CTY20_00810 [Hyphomicrobium sp.]
MNAGQRLTMIINFEADGSDAITVVSAPKGVMDHWAGAIEAYRIPVDRDLMLAMLKATYATPPAVEG